MLTQGHNTPVPSHLFQNVSDSVGAIIAATAITSPWWRDQLHIAAGLATDLAPIFGVFWLLVQIVYRLDHWSRKSDGGKE